MGTNRNPETLEAWTDFKAKIQELPAEGQAHVYEELIDHFFQNGESEAVLNFAEEMGNLLRATQRTPPQTGL